MKTPLALCFLTSSLALNAWLWHSMPATQRIYTRPREVFRTATAAKVSGQDGSALVGAASLEELAQFLNQQGLPQNVTRAWLAAEIESRFQERQKQITGTSELLKYWQNPTPLRLEQRIALAKLEIEKAQTKLDILGADPALATSEYGFLPSDKRDLAKIAVDGQRLLLEALGNGFGYMHTASELAEIERIKADGDSAISALLSAAEIRELRLRTDPAAADLRYQLRYQEVSQEVFAQIYDITVEVMDRAAAQGDKMTSQRSRDELDAEIKRRISDSSGPDVYKAVDQSLSLEFQSLGDLVKRAGLPSSTLAEVYALKESIQDKSLAIEQATGLTNAEKVDALKLLGGELKTKAETMLGTDAYTASKRLFDIWAGPLERGRVVLYSRDSTSSRTLRPEAH